MLITILRALCVVLWVSLSLTSVAMAEQYWNVYLLDQGEYDPVLQRAKFVQVKMPVDVSFLSNKEKQVLQQLFRVGHFMSEIYLRQLNPKNPQLRTELVAKNTDSFGKILLELFDLHFGPWDTIEGYHPFFNTEPRPPGAGFYPADLTREEFTRWLEQHPEDRPSFSSLYTVIRRSPDGLVALPYHEVYRQWLEPAADALREAARISANPSVKNYLSLCANALLDDNYLPADLAWMELKDTPLEIVIGPYEVYADNLFGYKAAYQAFLTVIDPKDRLELARFKKYLRQMEANLPIATHHKNFRRQFVSPVVVANQVQGGGFNVPGTQAMAFNLPNDERVREAKGTKNVILKNVIETKFQYILLPLATKIIHPKQLPLVNATYFFRHILFHELSHALGPGTLIKNGQQTTVSQELKELHWTLEEAKADTMGVYNILFMMEKGEFPQHEIGQLFTTYMVTLFRMMRFGLNDAASLSAMLQYRFHAENQAILYDASTRQFLVDEDKMNASIRALLSKILQTQLTADYLQVKAFLDQYTASNPDIEQAMEKTQYIPVDIQPIYPQQLDLP